MGCEEAGLILTAICSAPQSNNTQQSHMTTPPHTVMATRSPVKGNNQTKSWRNSVLMMMSIIRLWAVLPALNTHYISRGTCGASFCFTLIQTGSDIRTGFTLL